MESGGRVPREEDEIAHVGALTPARNPEVDARGRKKLEYFGNTFDGDPDGITKVIHKIIHGYYDGPWKTFGEVPQAVKEQWWLEFQSKYYWEDCQGPQLLKNWRAKCSRHISNTFCDHRNGKTKPKWVSFENWNTMMKFWKEDEGFQFKSETNKKNRASENQDRGSNYAGGSTSAAGYAIKFKRENGRDITIEELLRKTYTNSKTGEFDSKRAMICLERFNKLVAEWLETHDSLSKEKQEELWHIASGGEKKGHLFGLGSTYCKDRLVRNPPDFNPNAQRVPVLQPVVPVLQPVPRPAVVASSLSSAAPPVLQSSSRYPADQLVALMPPVVPIQAPPPPPMLQAGQPSIMSNNSLDPEVAYWEEKLRRIRAYQDEIRRIQMEMPQLSPPQPEASFQSLMNSMDSPPRSSYHFRSPMEINDTQR